MSSRPNYKEMIPMLTASFCAVMMVMMVLMMVMPMLHGHPKDSSDTTRDGEDSNARTS